MALPVNKVSASDLNGIGDVNEAESSSKWTAHTMLFTRLILFASLFACAVEAEIPAWAQTATSLELMKSSKDLLTSSENLLNLARAADSVNNSPDQGICFQLSHEADSIAEHLITLGGLLVLGTRMETTGDKTSVREFIRMVAGHYEKKADLSLKELHLRLARIERPRTAQEISRLGDHLQHALVLLRQLSQ